eukprot:TRINITY_DN6018_c0_g1_i1.p1 TRINITY_DN6018_c0_g1~~TRINITY_DN6018_c0_g1_i1.p1  ORF type:complete len:272 (-),score=33.13 TRINITY_DN6018_c0_g1_i1:136-951(-)
MIALLFCFFVTAAFCQVKEVHAFRFKDGNFTIKGEKLIKLIGSLYYFQMFSTPVIEFVGMDYLTMTPFTVLGMKQSSGPGKDFACIAGAWKFGNQERMFGNIVLDGSWDKAELTGDCMADSGAHLIFKSTNIKTSTMLYSPKEAGQRAKRLVGQKADRYSPSSVIYFSILDLVSNFPCVLLLHEQFPVTLDPEPGGIMVGASGEHCGILDDEGTKFVHSNPVEREVTLNSLAEISRYFPSGVIYKRYPKEPIPKLLINDQYYHCIEYMICI